MTVRCILYTSRSALASEYFQYVHARVAAQEDVVVVAAERTPPATLQRVRRIARKLRRLGVWQSLEVVSTLPLQRIYDRRDAVELETRLRALPRPAVTLDPRDVLHVRTINGDDAQAVVREANADVLVQAGAGILRRPLFSIPRLGSLNIHHGIAPLIRGMGSIYWGLWERRDDWIGATVHRIDDGLDTGEPLAYARVTPSPGEGFASLFARATEAGVSALLDVLGRLQEGASVGVAVAGGAGVYRSSFSGWKRWRLEVRLRREAAHPPTFA